MEINKVVGLSLPFVPCESPQYRPELLRRDVLRKQIVDCLCFVEGSINYPLCEGLLGIAVVQKVDQLEHRCALVGQGFPDEHWKARVLFDTFAVLGLLKILQRVKDRVMLCFSFDAYLYRLLKVSILNEPRE